ncbi:MAG: acetyl-CoA carboxylase biotin carboxyl carrier protein [Planctomycetia bacterium]|nr:acetyl-CoA carboxylase biotin carboxyl carrier protein [Planctomycetia bacterium]
MADKKDDVFDLKGIRLLVELMKENNVSELDLEQGGSRLSLRRALPGAAPVVVTQPVAAQPVPTAPVAAPAAPAKEPDYIKTITSPIVGVFYASPNPESDPFVKVGDSIAPGKVICLIEAMKVFNDIRAEFSGKITEVLVKNGDPLEYGTPLFKVDVR